MSELIERIHAWMAVSAGSAMPVTPEETRKAIAKAIRILGYGPPFDREQKQLNSLLMDAGADEMMCVAIWGYYHDFKMIQAGKPLKHRA